MDAAELARWTRFAGKGGIGKCTARIDCIAEEVGDLMFLKNDEITVLMQLNDDSLYLGYCEGVVGRFQKDNVTFHSKLKKPIIAKCSSTSASPSSSSDSHHTPISASPTTLSQRSSPQPPPSSQYSSSSVPLESPCIPPYSFSSPTHSCLDPAARDSPIPKSSSSPVLPLTTSDSTIARVSPRPRDELIDSHTMSPGPVPTLTVHPNYSSPSMALKSLSSHSHGLLSSISSSSPSSSSTIDSSPYTPPDSRSFANEKPPTHAHVDTQDISYDSSYSSYTEQSTRMSFGLADATGIGLSLLGNLGVGSGDGEYRSHYEEEEEEVTLGYADDDNEVEEGGLGALNRKVENKANWRTSTLPSPYDQEISPTQPSPKEPENDNLHSETQIKDKITFVHDLPSPYDSPPQPAESLPISPGKPAHETQTYPFSKNLTSPYDTLSQQNDVVPPGQNNLTPPIQDFKFPQNSNGPQSLQEPASEQTSSEDPSISVRDGVENPIDEVRGTVMGEERQETEDKGDRPEGELEEEEDDWNIYDDYRYSRFSARYSRYSRFSMGSGARGSQSSASLLAGKDVPVPPMPTSPSLKEFEMGTVARMSISSGGAVPSPPSIPASTSTPTTTTTRTSTIDPPPRSRAGSSSSFYSAQSDTRTIESTTQSDTHTIDSTTQSVYSHSSLLSTQFPGVPGSERPPHLAHVDGVRESVIGHVAHALSIDAALAAVMGEISAPVSPLLHTSFGSPLASPVTTGGSVRERGRRVRESEVSRGASVSTTATSPLLHTTFGSTESGASSVRASASTGLSSMRVSAAGAGDGMGIATTGAGIASVLRMRLESERERETTIQSTIERAKTPESKQIRDEGEGISMRPIVVEDDVEGPSHVNDNVLRILTDSPVPLQEGEGEDSVAVEGPSMSSVSMYSGETAETITATTALLPRQGSVVAVSPQQPSSIPRSSFQSSALPAAPARPPTHNGSRPRTSLFLPHPNAPKPPPLLQSQGPMYARFGVMPGHQGPGAQHHPIPPITANVDPSQTVSMSGAPPNATPHSVLVLRQVIARLRTQQWSGRGPPTVFARCELDLTSSFGPVPVWFSTEPIAKVGNGFRVGTPVGAGPQGIGGSRVGNLASARQQPSGGMAMGADGNMGSKGSAEAPPPNPSGFSMDGGSTQPLRIKRATTTPGVLEEIRKPSILNGVSGMMGNAFAGKNQNALTSTSGRTPGTLPRNNMLMPGMSNERSTPDVIQRTNFVPQVGGVRPRSRSFSGFNSTPTQHPQWSHEEPQEMPKALSASSGTPHTPSGVLAPPRTSSKPSPLSLLHNNNTASVRPSLRSPMSPISQSPSLMHFTSLSSAPPSGGQPDVRTPISPTSPLSQLLPAPQFASFTTPPLSDGQLHVVTTISPPPVSPSVPSRSEKDPSSPVPLSPFPLAQHAHTASVRSSSVSPNQYSITSPQPWLNHRAGTSDGDSLRSETQSLMSPPPMEPSSRSSPLAQELCLRTKMSLPVLRGKKSTKFRTDETASVTSSNSRAEEYETVQVQDMDFELIKPTLPLSASGRASQDSHDLVLDDSYSPLGDASSMMSGAVPPRSPLALVELSCADAGSPKTCSSHDSMDAHRHRELKWMSLLPATPPSQARKTKKVRRLLLEGVPNSVRYLVWCHLTDSKARAIPNVYGQLGRRGRVPVFKEIERDASHLFPDQLQLHSDAGPLVSLLQAYLSMVPDIQYNSGLTSIAGHLLLLSPEEDAFWIFVSMMDTHLRAYFSANPIQMEVDAALFSKAVDNMDAVIGKKLFITLGISPSSICRLWFSTLFVGTLPVDYLHRVWDLFLYDGVTFLFRVGMALVHCCRQLLLRSTTEASALEQLSRPPSASLPPNADAFLALALSMKLKDDDTRRQRIKMEAQVKRHTQARVPIIAGPGMQTTSISLPKS